MSVISNSTQQHDIPHESLLIKTSMEELNTADLSKAARLGFFYVKIPDDCQTFIKPALDFAVEHFKNKKGVDSQEQETGYDSFGEKYQNEPHLIPSELWKEKLPKKFDKLPTKMHSIAVEVLKKVLSTFGLSAEDQAKLSGNATDGKGYKYCTFNHYRPELNSKEGLGIHRDFGQITVLFINQWGLKAKVEGKWKDIPPLADHFVIILSQALRKSN